MDFFTRFFLHLHPKHLSISCDFQEVGLYCTVISLLPNLFLYFSGELVTSSSSVTLSCSSFRLTRRSFALTYFCIFEDGWKAMKPFSHDVLFAYLQGLSGPKTPTGPPTSQEEQWKQMQQARQQQQQGQQQPQQPNFPMPDPRSQGEFLDSILYHTSSLT